LTTKLLNCQRTEARLRLSQRLKAKGPAVIAGPSSFSFWLCG